MISKKYVKMINEAFFVCKGSRIYVVDKENIYRIEILLLRKNDGNNFALQLFVSG